MTLLSKRFSDQINWILEVLVLANIISSTHFIYDEEYLPKVVVPRKGLALGLS